MRSRNIRTFTVNLSCVEEGSGNVRTGGILCCPLTVVHRRLHRFFFVVVRFNLYPGDLTKPLIVMYLLVATDISHPFRRNSLAAFC